MKLISIDPGKEGGLAILKNGEILDSRRMPVIGKEIDLDYLYDWIISIDTFWNVNDFAIIEKVGAMPGQGVTSMFSFGFSTGIIHGLMRGMGISRRIVHPRTWKAKILAGTDKSKESAINHVKRAYPNINLLATPRSKKPHLGIVDAICIAEYGWREFGRKLNEKGE